LDEWVIGLGAGIALLLVGVVAIARNWGPGASAGVEHVGPIGAVRASGGGAVIFVVGAGLLILSIFKLGEESGRLDSRSVTATASSVHAPDRGITYDARNTLDDNENTAWNSNGDPIGQTIRYDFGREVTLDRISLRNGYAKDPTTFAENTRLQRVRLTTDDGPVATDELADTMSVQDIDEDFGETESLTIEVETVYRGDRFNDAALTDIQFWGPDL
jgi:hypothetical protein